MTDLIGGTRADKADPRLEAMGAVDELNSICGVVRAAVPEDSACRTDTEACLSIVQQELFDLGALLALAPGTEAPGMPVVTAKQVARLETWIDRYRETLPELDSFVLPGGGMAGAQAYLARAVCRRAERRVWALHAEAPLPETVPVYLNRLSDFLFVFARWIVRGTGEDEVLWKPNVEPGADAT